jgi:nucleoside-diphosphate-sugar epimerase
MRILVAGGAGYIGSRLCPELLKLGHEVDVVDLFWFGCHLPIPQAHAFGVLANFRDEVGLRKANVFDLKAEDLYDYDQVIFLAGLSNDPMANFAPAQNFVYNGAAPAYLAYIAKQAGVERFIYASSCSVYGFNEKDLSTENAQIACSYPYGLSKLQGEQAVLQLADANFSVIALRQGTVSGYSPRMRFDLIVNTMFRAALKDKKIIVSNPAIWRPILGITDAVRAYDRAIRAHSEITGVYNVASFNTTVGEVAEKVRDFVGSSVEIVLSHVPDVRNYRVSITKAMGDLNMYPLDTIHSILAELAQTNSIALDSDECYNLKVLKKSIIL